MKGSCCDCGAGRHGEFQTAHNARKETATDMRRWPCETEMKELATRSTKACNRGRLRGNHPRGDEANMGQTKQSAGEGSDGAHCAQVDPSGSVGVIGLDPGCNGPDVSEKQLASSRKHFSARQAHAMETRAGSRQVPWIRVRIFAQISQRSLCSLKLRIHFGVVASSPHVRGGSELPRPGSERCQGCFIFDAVGRSLPHVDNVLMRGRKH